MTKKQKQQKLRIRGGLLPEQYLNETEQKKLLRHVKARADLARARGSQRGVIDEMIVVLLLNTGLRASELCNLRIADVPPAHGKSVIVVRKGKRGIVRAVVIGPHLQDMIKRFIKFYRKNAKTSYRLLQSEWGTALSYFSLWSKIHRIGNAAGIKKLHPHVLRHTYLTRLYNIEHDLRFVQDQAGHADPKTTAIYAQTDQTARRRQVEALEASLDAANPKPG
ncbi:Tyrosine recombinase XerH [subsurface metagenome]